MSQFLVRKYFHPCFEIFVNYSLKIIYFTILVKSQIIIHVFLFSTSMLISLPFWSNLKLM